ncbi:hypothetical protein PsAD37_04011 [Pseudovibrio sp. Ad37]|nr:hypothetical protein PsAD37_04011 [Pseudovibrio sp. Ad37]
MKNLSRVQLAQEHYKVQDQIVNERSKLIRHHHLKLTHLGWHKSSRRTALI